MMYREAEDKGKFNSASSKQIRDLDTNEDVYAEDLQQIGRESKMRIWANVLIFLLVVAVMIVKSLIE